MAFEHRRYGSKHLAFRVDAQGPDAILHPHTGQVTGHKKPLVAEFGILGAEYIARDKDGEPLYRADDGSPFVSVDKRGHFWDSEVAQQQNNWTDEETEAVLLAVEYECKRQPELVWRLEAPVLAAPWPTFDSQDDQAAVAVAIETGQVQEALAYARQQERKKVVSELEAHLAEQTAEAEAEQALTAA